MPCGSAFIRDEAVLTITMYRMYGLPRMNALPQSFLWREQKMTSGTPFTLYSGQSGRDL
jgi:hypothetical protein